MLRMSGSGSCALLVLCLVVVVAATSCQTEKSPMQPAGIEAVSAAETAGVEGMRPSFVPGELLVKFRAGVSESDRAAAVGAVSGSIGARLVTAAMRAAGDPEGVTIVRTGMEVAGAVDALRNRAGVEYAEPNCYYYPDVVSNDTYFTSGSLWGMYGNASVPANQYGSQAAEAWAAGHIGSATVLVGEIDEGIMFSHTDLAGQIWTNPYDPADGIDNDGNGYIDDIHGWDFDGNNNTIYDGSVDDHGSHVAGTIGAKGGNGLGVVGVCWNIQIISGKFLGKRGGTTANAILALDYITDLKNRHGLNIVATNNSWGGGLFSQALQDAVERSNQASIVCIVAAGNEGSNNDVTPSYPSCYPNANILSVASITSTGALSSFSNYGLTTVDLAAPGSSIYSTIPSRQGTSTYASYSGTSMAAPHVTGGVALYAASHPGASVAEIRTAVLGSAAPTASLAGKCVTGARLDLSGF